MLPGIPTMGPSHIIIATIRNAIKRVNKIASTIPNPMTYLIRCCPAKIRLATQKANPAAIRLNLPPRPKVAITKQTKAKIKRTNDNMCFPFSYIYITVTRLP